MATYYPYFLNRAQKPLWASVFLPLKIGIMAAILPSVKFLSGRGNKRTYLKVFYVGSPLSGGLAPWNYSTVLPPLRNW